MVLLLCHQERCLRSEVPVLTLLFLFQFAVDPHDQIVRGHLILLDFQSDFQFRLIHSL